MYIVAPYQSNDKQTEGNGSNTSERGLWQPCCSSPEWVVLTRTVALARRSFEFLTNCVRTFKSHGCSIFCESATAFKSYNVLFRVHPDFNFDITSSSTSESLENSENDDGVIESAYTRSMEARYAGPNALCRKIYRNVYPNVEEPVCTTWRPVSDLVASLREAFGDQAIFFYNDLSPEIIALLWRPVTFEKSSLSVMASDHAKPFFSCWDDDSTVIRNEKDLVREMSLYFQEMVTSVKVMNFDKEKQISKKIKIKK